jgi:hypothetical protein
MLECGVEEGYRSYICTHVLEDKMRVCRKQWKVGVSCVKLYLLLVNVAKRSYARHGNRMSSQCPKR